MMQKNSYLLGVGRKDEERLALLNELFGETSRHFLLKAGLRSGQRVLEIGCGTGNMTGWIADQVGKQGHVTAVDISQEQIDIAKENNKSHDNIAFIVKSLFELSDLSPFDLIYSRFVIMHQTQSVDALQSLMSLLKPGGAIVCEEGTNSVSACCPHSDVFQRYRDLLLVLYKMKNIDYNIGEKMHLYFHQLGLKNITTNFVQPIYQSSEQKKMMLLFLLEMKDLYIQNKIITEADIDQLIVDMEKFIQDDSYLISCLRTTQIYGNYISHK